MTALTKIKFKKTIIDIGFELIINCIILSMAYLADKFLLTLLFYLPFHLLRYAFPKIFHARNSKPFFNLCRCIFYSSLCYFIAMRLMFPLGVSIFSSVIIGMLMNSALYKIQDYLDLQKEVAKKTIDIYSMTEDELRNYAKSKGLSEMIIDTLVLRVINNYRWCEIQQERNYTREGIKYHKQRICKVLNVKL